MLTDRNTTVTGAAFTKAPNDSAFGKVFLYNMDMNSFSTSSDPMDPIASMISNSKTAMFSFHPIISERQEYRNCSVSKNFLFII